MTMQMDNHHSPTGNTTVQQNSCCASCANFEQRIRDLENRVGGSGGGQEEPSKLVVTASKLQNGRKQARGDRSTLVDIIAEDVGIIGLKESLTWKPKVLKRIWVVFLLAGLAATIYYMEQNIEKYLQDNIATKVSFTQLPEYPFPPFVACPPWPYDFVKAITTTGLSLDAVKYSLGYLVSGNTITTPLDNGMARAKREFLNFYSKRNFTSLLDYYETIAADATDVTNFSSEESCESQVCYACNSCSNDSRPAAVKRIITSTGVCYVFSFPPATEKLDYGAPDMIITNTNDPDVFVDPSRDTAPVWRVDLLPNMGNAGAGVEVGRGSYTVKVSSHKVIVMENSATHKCSREPNRIDQPDPQELCMEQCLTRRQRASGAYFNLLNGSRWAGDILNFYDWALTNISAADVGVDILNVSRIHPNVSTSAVGSQPEQGNCDTECNVPCRRTVFELDTQYNHKETIVDALNYTSILMLSFEHTGLRQGFVIYEEVETMSFSDFISNVGGTFGLFLGCTFFTLLQLVLSVVKHVSK